MGDSLFGISIEVSKFFSYLDMLEMKFEVFMRH